jgi:transcriptional regulator with XRE-family HTH domain
MSGLAQRIKQAREAKHLTVEDVERALRIRRRYLHAIEAGDFAQLPDGPASRGFVKNYARLVGLDPDESLSLFEAEYGIPEIHLKEDIPPPPEREQQQSEYTRLVLPDLRWKGNIPAPESAELDSEMVSEELEMGTGVTVPEIARIDGTTGKAVVMRPARDVQAAKSSFRMRGGKRVPGLDTDFDPPKRVVARPSMKRLGGGMLDQSEDLLRLLGYLGGGLLALALVLVLANTVGRSALNRLSAWWNAPAARATPAVIRITPAAPNGARPTLPPITIIAPAVRPAAGGQIELTPLAPAAQPPAAVTPAAPGAAPAVAPLESAITVPPGPGGDLSLALDVRERATIKVTVDGREVFNGAPPLGPLPAWTAARDIVLETTNAGAFEATINGEPRGPLGQREQAVRLTYALP